MMKLYMILDVKEPDVRAIRRDRMIGTVVRASSSTLTRYPDGYYEGFTQQDVSLWYGGKSDYCEACHLAVKLKPLQQSNTLDKGLI